jgi:excisionase family DNA binding protein
MKRKEVMTTGEVARICHVAPRTVSKWFDSGKLRGYRIPGSRDRRIPIQQLVQFMRAHGMPLADLEGPAIRVLIVDADTPAANAVAQSLSQTPRYQLATAANDFKAGMLAEKFQPHVIFIDFAGQSGAIDTLTHIRSNPALAATKVVAVVTEPFAPDEAAAWIKQGFDLVLAKPYQVQAVAAMIEQATDLAA